MRLPKHEGAAANSAWTDSYAARVLAIALTAQSEFWKHVDELRRGGDAEAIVGAHGYVRRDQGRRLELLAEYLRAGARTVEPMAHAYVWMLGCPGWWVRGVPGPTAPRRAVRSDARDALTRAALRVARRGAGRCAEPTCCAVAPGKLGVGALLAAHSSGDYCAACAQGPPHAIVDPAYVRRRGVEEERVLFDRAIASVLGGTSKAHRRRASTSALHIETIE